MTESAQSGPGAIVGGRYRLLELLGSGGMGEVYRALPLDGGGPEVALKLILPARLADETSRRRFAQECDLASRLRHENLVSILEYDAGGERPWYAMRRCHGATLREILAGVPMSLDEVVRLAAGLVEALEAIHRAGIVHRDVKPANVLVEDGVARLADFGIARAADSAERLTSSDQAVGTVAYAAPEVLLGEPATPASDVYSLGVVLYEMLTGHLPHGASVGFPQAVARLTSPPRRIRELSPSLPVWIEPVVMGCLAEDPRSRPSAAQLRLTLGKGGADAPPKASAIRRWKAAAAIAVSVLAVAAAVTAAFLPRPGSAPAGTTPPGAVAAPEAASATPAGGVEALFDTGLNPSVTTRPRAYVPAREGAAPGAAVSPTPSRALKLTFLSSRSETPAGYAGTRNLTLLLAASPEPPGVTSPDREFEHGEVLTLLIEPSSAGHLYVVNLGSDLLTRQVLYPPPGASPEVVREGPVTIGPLRVDPPAGVDRLTILFSPEPIGGLVDGTLVSRELPGTGWTSHPREEVLASDGRVTALYFLGDSRGRVRAEVDIRHSGDRRQEGSLPAPARVALDAPPPG